MPPSTCSRRSDGDFARSTARGTRRPRDQREKDGSLKLTQSRILTTTGFVYTVTRIPLSVAIGFTGILATLRGTKGAVHEVRERKSHVGSNAQSAHELLAQVGPDAAIVLVCCDDQEMRQAVVAQAADRASESWDGPRAEFLAVLDPGSQHDWVRAALGEPSKPDRASGDIRARWPSPVL
jgi:hypothetical protein